MTLTRLITPGMRSGLLIGIGSALLVAPFVLGLSPAALVTGFAVGVLAVALGIAGTDGSSERGTISLGAQSAYDRGLALGLLVTAVLFGLAGQQDALAVFGATGLGTLLLATTTRYSVAPA